MKLFKRLLNTIKQSSTRTPQNVVKNVPPPKPQYTITEYGKAFGGTTSDVVWVPVSMKPILHRSHRDKWSWRTRVYGFKDFRHINVSNLYAIAQNANGDWYVGVDKTWPTDQPVFKDYCNQNGKLPDQPGAFMGFSEEDAADFDQAFNADVGDRD